MSNLLLLKSPIVGLLLVASNSICLINHPFLVVQSTTCSGTISHISTTYLVVLGASQHPPSIPPASPQRQPAIPRPPRPSLRRLTQPVDLRWTLGVKPHRYGLHLGYRMVIEWYHHVIWLMYGRSM
jgi:hypothetical protein